MKPSNYSNRTDLVVCLHASASSSRQWKGLATELASELEVICPDLVGYGKAAPFDDTGAFGFSKEIHTVVDQIGTRWTDSRTRIHLVGHSYGAATAIQFAHRLPERVASLTLFEPVLFALLANDDALSREFDEISQFGNYIRSKVGRRFGRKKAARRFIEYWTGKGVWQFLPAERRQRFARLMPKVAAEFEAIASSPIHRRDLESLDVPVRLIYGSATRGPTRAVSEMLAATLPNVEAFEMSDANHMAPVTTPDRVNPMFAAHIRRVAGLEFRAAA
jgi:pimeloyl-ACP methyl ester carboxylesterase